MTTEKKKIVLGMSGGTDSSVAALLLQQAGYEVVGVTFRFYEKDGNTTYLEQAKDLAHQLNFEHHTVDVRETFQHRIIDYFIGDYMQGRTPVPCIVCNNYLKWPLLADMADKLEISEIAMGHYVQKVSHKGVFYIADGDDRDKNQAFFLWGVTQEILQRATFPLGQLTKGEIRQIAAQNGLHKAATLKDSMGVCFCPGDYRTFLKGRVDSCMIKAGNFVDSKGKYMGRHQGYPFYTVGQRRGLGLQLNHPTFVKEIEPETNRITLAPLCEMYKSTMHLSQVHVISRNDFAPEQRVTCKIRYRKQETPCRVEFVGESEALVYFETPVNSIATGQAAAFYCNNRVLGGGIIEKAY